MVMKVPQSSYRRLKLLYRLLGVVFALGCVVWYARRKVPFGGGAASLTPLADIPAPKAAIV